MQYKGTNYTRSDLLTKVGNIAQLGGTRHYQLSDGRSKGVSAVDFDTGSGFRFTVIPDRGLDISNASYRGTNLVYLTQNGEAHPAYYEPQGMNWLRTFFGGLLTTCGLTYFGAPGKDDDEDLGLHGRYAATPARQVRDNSGWDGDEYKLEISGIVEECILFGDKIRLTRTISSHIGAKSLLVHDKVENFGFHSSPFTILYHVNTGFPLLDQSSELILSAKDCEPCDDWSATGMDSKFTFSEPIEGFAEQNYLYRMASDEDGCGTACLVNRKLDDGLGLYIRFDTSTLPFFNEWKMMGQGDYVAAIEPCNVICENRAVLRERGLLPFLEPGETIEMKLEIGVVEGEEEIDSLIERIKTISGGCK